MRVRRRPGPEPNPAVGAGGRVWLRPATAVALAALVTGCGSDGTAPAPAGAATDELRLGLTEWSVETGGAQLLPGDVQVRVTNTGGTSHDVVIHGEQGTWASPVLEPGQDHAMVISVVAGEELDLVCTLTGHHAQGMHTTIDVVEEDAVEEQAVEQ